MLTYLFSTPVSTIDKRAIQIYIYKVFFIHSNKYNTIIDHNYVSTPVPTMDERPIQIYMHNIYILINLE